MTAALVLVHLGLKTLQTAFATLQVIKSYHVSRAQLRIGPYNLTYNVSKTLFRILYYILHKLKPALYPECATVQFPFKNSADLIHGKKS